MTDIKTLSTEVVYQNKWMTVREDKIRRSSGTEGFMVSSINRIVR
ncbi:hypothetical protein JCM19233_3044 [Vibrio astriarenae]|nr:hypothetical protein JCM19233_3044 [Vibrio sp. C7]